MPRLLGLVRILLLQCCRCGWIGFGAIGRLLGVEKLLKEFVVCGQAQSSFCRREPLVIRVSHSFGSRPFEYVRQSAKEPATWRSRVTIYRVASRRIRWVYSRPQTWLVEQRFTLAATCLLGLCFTDGGSIGAAPICGARHMLCYGLT